MSMQLIEWIGRVSVGIFVAFVLYFVARRLFPQLWLWRTGFDEMIVRNIGNVDPTAKP